jgi:hypothetical protein
VSTRAAGTIGNVVEREPLYRRVLGTQFAELHPILRRFHTSAGGMIGIGRFRVRRHPGRLRGTLAALLRLPPTSDATEVRLGVFPAGAGERWVRSFDGIPLVTLQTWRGGLLIEQAGPAHFGLAVEVLNGGMVFRSKRVWLFGVELPGDLAPSIRATAVPTDRGWTADVRLSVPLLGPLLDYEGEVIPQWTPP